MKLTDKVLVYLLSEREVTLQNVATDFELKNETVYNCLVRINEMYPDIIYIDEDKFYLNEKNIPESLYRQLNISRNYLVDNLSINNRRILILLKLLTENEFISLYEISDYISVSKNTALNDINYLREKLNEKNIKLNYSRKNGYVLEAKEHTLRKLTVNIVLKVLEFPIGKLVLNKLNYIKINDSSLLKSKIEKIEKQFSFTFSDEMFERLPIILLIIIKRIDAHRRRDFSLPKTIENITDTKEYIETSSLFWNYTFLTEDDLIYLSLLILSSNVLDSGSGLEDLIGVEQYDYVEIMVEEFIAGIENRLAIQFTDQQKLKSTLIQHMIPALHRNLLGLNISNPLTMQFITEYKSIFNLVKEELLRFHSVLNNKLSNNEIAYIAMIVLSSIIGNSDWLGQKTFTAIVVCESGTSLSNLLREQLKELFPTIEFTRTLSIRQYRRERIKEDFVFSTIPMKEAFNVSSIMSNADKEELVIDVENTIEQNSWNKTQLIMSYLNEYIKSDKKGDAFNHLHQLFTNKDELNQHEKETESLLVSCDQINIYDYEIEWENILTQSFEPLLKRGSIIERYVKSTKEKFKKYYESQIIGPGVLLPHATPEDGVIEADIQINIFKTPLKSPNGTPYDVVIALAPDSENKHLQWLLKINKKMKNEMIKKAVIESTDKKEIFELLK